MQNLKALSEMDYTDLADDFSNNLRMCIELGVDMSVLVGVLQLCREAPCCTNLVEQGHGSGAATLKAHSQFGTRSLQARASIHQCRGLFSKSSLEQTTGRLEEQMVKKRKSLRGARYSAQQAFFSFLQRDPFHERPEGMEATEWARRCLIEHRAKFKQLSWEQKMEFKAEADIIDMQRRRMWQDELQHLQERRALVLRQLEEDKEELAGKPNLVTVHRLDAEALRRCADTVDTFRSESTLAGMREELLQSAEAPDNAMLDFLRERAGLFEKPTPSPPDCIHIVALNREVFYGTAVFLPTDGTGDIPNQIYMPVIALQRPYSVVWLRLDRIPVVWRADFCERAAQPLPKIVPDPCGAQVHLRLGALPGGQGRVVGLGGA